MPFLPSAQTIFASSSATSQTVFNEFLPFAYFAIGLVVGSLVIWWMIHGLPHMIKKLFTKEKDWDK